MKHLYYHRFIICLLMAFGALCTGCSNATTGNQSSMPESQTKAGVSESADSAGLIKKTTVLANLDNVKMLRTEDPSLIHKPQNQIVFGDHGQGTAYIAEKDGKQYVVHNGKAGKYYDGIDHLTISPDGRRVAYRRNFKDKQQIVVDGVEGLQAYDNIRNLSFSPDSRHFSYLAEFNDSLMLFLDGKLFEGGKDFSNIFYTADASKLLYASTPVGMETRLVVVDLNSGARKLYPCTNYILEKKTQRVALTVAEGDRLWVTDFSLFSPQEVRKSSGSYNLVTNVVFGSDGTTVAFTGVRGTDNFLVVNGKEEPLPGGLAIIDYPAIRPDTNDAAIILATSDRYNRRYFISKATHNDDADRRQYDQIKELVYGKGNISAYLARKGEKWCLVLSGKSGPAFDMIVSPVFSPDGTKIVYRARKAGKRFVVVTDVKKNEHRQLAEYDVVSPIVFTADGKSIAYGAKDSDKLIWKVDSI